MKPSAMFALATAAAVATLPLYAQEPPAAEAAEEAAEEKLSLDDITAKLLPGDLHLEATIEVTGSYFKQGDDKDSDVNLDTAELDLTGNLTDNLSLFASLLYEEGEENNHVIFDQAYFMYAIEQLEGLSLVGGKITMPFGVYNTALISDPLTLQLGEITDAAFGLAFESEHIDLNAYVFGGDIEDDPDEVCWLASVTLKPNENISVWAGLVSDIAECAMDDDINDAIAEAEEAGTDTGYDAALGVNAGAMVTVGDLTVSAEYVGATDDIELCGEATGKPQAWAVDASFAATEKLTLGARYEGSKEWADMPETQFGAGAEYAINDNLAVAFEYLYGQYDEEWSENDDDSHTASLRFAVTF